MDSAAEKAKVFAGCVILVYRQISLPPYRTFYMRIELSRVCLGIHQYRSVSRMSVCLRLSRAAVIPVALRFKVFLVPSQCSACSAAIEYEIRGFARQVINKPPYSRAYLLPKVRRAYVNRAAEHGSGALSVGSVRDSASRLSFDSVESVTHKAAAFKQHCVSRLHINVSVTQYRFFRAFAVVFFFSVYRIDIVYHNITCDC